MKMVIMWPAAFILEFFAVENFATKLAFRFIRPGVDNPFYHACNFVNDCMYYVSDNEYDCNIVV